MLLEIDVQGLSRRVLSQLLTALPFAVGGRADTTLSQKLKFPEGFLWGAATSAYQVEGAVREGGRTSTIWDTFSHRPGRVVNGDTGDVADDHYHRYESDIDLLRDVGFGAYRFSIAWSRIFPSASGPINPDGLAFYSRLIDALLKKGLVPFCTIYHWDLPQYLQDRGGWENVDTASQFADYASHIARLFGDRVPFFVTLNEMRSFVDFGYRDGRYAPGLRLPLQRVYQARHNALLAHGLGLQAIRASAPSAVRVGIAENPIATVPLSSNDRDVAAATAAFREENAPFLTAILEGAYTDGYLASVGADAPRVASRDMALISAPIDFVGVNLYQPTYVRPDGSKQGYSIIPTPATFPKMDSDWLTVGPEIMYWVPHFLAKNGKVKSIYITENGAPGDDQADADGQIFDIDRIMYLRNYLGMMQAAIAKGSPIKGYFLWSLLDNFEWDKGYASRFGIYHVDFSSQQRTPKASTRFMAEFIRANT